MKFKDIIFILALLLPPCTLHAFNKMCHAGGRDITPFDKHIGAQRVPMYAHIVCMVHKDEDAKDNGDKKACTETVKIDLTVYDNTTVSVPSSTGSSR